MRTEEEVRADHNDPPLGSFPDDSPCPKCNTRLLLHSHGDIAAECPKCGYFVTCEEALHKKDGE